MTMEHTLHKLEQIAREKAIFGVVMVYNSIWRKWWIISIPFFHKLLFLSHITYIIYIGNQITLLVTLQYEGNA